MSQPKSNASYWHQVGSTPLVGCTIDAYFRDVCARHGQREAVVSLEQNIRVTYAELDDRVDEMARGLLALGVDPGGRVGIWATDNVEWIVIQLATARIGAVLVNINPANRRFELEHALKLARVQVFIMIPGFRGSEYTDTICEICPEALACDPDELRPARLPSLRHLIVYDPSTRGEATRPTPAFMTWRQVVERGRDLPTDATAVRAAHVDCDDAVNIQFTSGTTGAPKAVTLTHHNILNNGYFVGEAMRFTPEDRLCVPVPFFHCFGMVVSNLACLTHGAAIIIPSPHFEAGSTLAAIESERCTAIHGVPTMFIAELEHPDYPKRDLSSLRTGIIAGAPCPPPLMRRIIDDMGCKEILIGYGLTESSPVTHLTDADDSFEQRTESVGLSLAHQEAKVIDPETGLTVPFGTQGEICFRGYHVMRGYFDQPEATREAIDEAGWLHSGDLGVMSDDGYVSITGRLKDMIIRGGENIYPAEIESFYLEHPKVAVAVVVGLPHEAWGEQVGMWVTLREGMETTAEELREYAKGQLAHFKIPTIVRVVDEFPLTTSGKVQKFKIREMFVEDEPAPAAR